MEVSAIITVNNMLPGTTDELEPVSLGGDEGAQAGPKAQANIPPPTEPEVTDPWAIDDSTPTTFATEATSPPPPADTAEALSKLKFSSQRLVTNLDQKLGLSQAWGMLGTSVKNIDEKAHVSSTVKSAGSTLGTWFSGLDQQYHISEKSKGIGSTIAETGKGIGTTIAAIVPTEEISQGLTTTTRALQTFDENHGITKTTAATLAEGADFLTNTITGSGGNGGETPGTAGDDTAAVDADGLPSSFQK